MNRVLAPVLAAVLLCSASCGSSGGDEGPSAAAVEDSLRADLAAGGDRVVDLGMSEPKVVTCEKDAGSETGWRCTVTTAGGRNILCLVEADSESGRPSRRVCAPVDN